MNDSYNKGLYDGLKVRLESIKPQDGEVIVCGLPTENISYEEAQLYYNAIKELFPENPLIVTLGTINIIKGDDKIDRLLR